MVVPRFEFSSWMIMNRFDDLSPQRCISKRICKSSLKSRTGCRPSMMAEALQPDLILLDIGLPRLNGIDAARRIVRLAPSAKMIFLTQESSVDVVREAFSLGAWGYVLKAKAGHELLIAVESVLQDKKFAGSGLGGIGKLRAVGRPVPRDGLTA